MRVCRQCSREKRGPGFFCLCDAVLPVEPGKPVAGYFVWTFEPGEVPVWQLKLVGHLVPEGIRNRLEAYKGDNDPKLLVVVIGHISDNRERMTVTDHWSYVRVQMPADVPETIDLPANA